MGIYAGAPVPDPFHKEERLLMCVCLPKPILLRTGRPPSSFNVRYIYTLYTRIPRSRYYQGDDVPHDKSPGHTQNGLAYSPKVPAGLRLAPGAALTTKALALSNNSSDAAVRNGRGETVGNGGRMWVEAAASGVQGLRITVSSSGRTETQAVAVKFSGAKQRPFLLHSIL
jgi:hypothetical protein